VSRRLRDGRRLVTYLEEWGAALLGEKKRERNDCGLWRKGEKEGREKKKR
jgi:hypothetical protein